jgi:holin-like protein
MQKIDTEYLDEELEEIVEETEKKQSEEENKKEKTPLILQIGIVLFLCLVGEWIAKLLPIPFPGSVISMILLFLLLLTGALKVEHIRQKADFMLKNMAFFFIPAGISILEYLDAVKGNILTLLLICLITTLITFGVTACTVRFVLFLQEKWMKRRSEND